MAKLKTTTPAETTLARLLQRRQRAWEEMGRHHGSLSSLEPEARAAADKASFAFNDADRQIVAALNLAGRPVRVGEHELHLTAHGDNFAVVDPATKEPIHGRRQGNKQVIHLYRYPEAKGLGRRNAPEVCP